MGMRGALSIILPLLSILNLRAGNFSQTCANITLGGAVLEARCLNLENDYEDTGLNLNRYIANINGELKAVPNGNFIASCDHVKLKDSDPSVLQASCKDVEGKSHSTSIDLDKYVANINGELVWTVRSPLNSTVTEPNPLKQSISPLE